ncbi:cobalamin-binding protein [Agaribacter flavus]|uniref:Cobalamin-binding protein n=1 Tax=Agaribacter flavus TaxID=1902781 RepID=A0ABV7FR08_9ALTE
MLRYLKLWLGVVLLGAAPYLAASSLANTSVSRDNGLSNEEKQDLRFIVLAPHIVETMFDIGAGAQIIGTSEHADYPLAAKAIPRVGNYARLQIEKILQLRPDFVIAWKTGNPSDDIARLKKYGINIVYSHPTRLEDVESEINMLGELTGRQTRASKLAKEYSARLSALRERYQEAAPISVFYELWPRPLRTVAANAWPQQQLTLCGARNPFVDAKEDYPQVALEKVLEYQPQIIIQALSAGVENPDSIQWQQWPKIPAVKHQQILQPNADKVHRMTRRMLDELTLLCEQIDTARRVYGL